MFVNSELSNPSEKASDKLICPRILRLFPKGHNGKNRFPPFARAWKCREATVLPYRRGKKHSEKKVYKPGLDTLEKLSSEACFNSWKPSLSDQLTVGTSSRPLMLSVAASQDPRIHSLECGGTRGG